MNPFALLYEYPDERDVEARPDVMTFTTPVLDVDLAASAQTVLQEIYSALMNFVQKSTGQKAVCLAGGVALNCVANGMLFDNTDFRDVYVQPAANDSGTSIGAALYVSIRFWANREPARCGMSITEPNTRMKTSMPLWRSPAHSITA